ncbi:MAG: hypothetical protein AB7P34_10240 [Vicinamibacterales bacterium]
MATVPDPVLLAADVTETNEPLLLAVHAQPPSVETPIVAVPPTPAMFNVVLPSAYEQLPVGGGVGDDGVLEQAAIAMGVIRMPNSSWRTYPP